jgi:hypothetical protein
MNITEIVDAAKTSSTQAAPVQPSITLDFRQATDLLEMFGGEPTEITLMTGDDADALCQQEATGRLKSLVDTHTKPSYNMRTP